MKIRVYERDDGKFLLKIDKYHVGYQTGRDLVFKAKNGSYINIKDNGVVVDSWQGRILRVKKSSPTVGYKYKKNGTIITVEKYQERREKLYTNVRDHDGRFYTVEQKDKWEKFSKSVEPVHEEKTEEVLVFNDEIVFCGYISSQERFITPTPSLIKEEASWFTFNYNAAMIMFFIELCNEYGFKYELSDNRNNSLEYAKVDDEFFTIHYHANYNLRPENFNGFKGSNTFSGNLSQCISERDCLYDFLRSAFEREKIIRSGILNIEDMTKKLKDVKSGKLSIDALIEMATYSAN